MKDRISAERACKDPNPIIDGRKANVNLAYLGAKPRGNLQLAGIQTLMCYSKCYNFSTFIRFTTITTSNSTTSIISRSFRVSNKFIISTSLF